MPSIGTTSKPAYVYDAGTDTWIPIGPGEHTHDYAASAHNHDSTYIASSLVDAKGDLLVGSADNTVSRLAVGTNGYYLQADSAEASGLKWASPPSGGKVLQVVQGTTTTETAVSTTTYVDSTLTATITPSATNSKILVLITQICRKAGDVEGGLRLLRGATTILQVANADLLYTASTLTLRGITVGANYLDSPNTTSATTYKTQINSTGATFYAQGSSHFSSMTLLEIGA